jgi:peptidoglycan/xylan/chitin deacetylase (PgdA/CDA1 family)
MTRPSLTSISHVLAVCLALSIGDARADDPAVEIHDQLRTASTGERRVALTLDACSGAFDEELIDFLVRNRIPATVFATKRWLDRNPGGVLILKNHLDLFDIEDHGENHIPPVIGAGRRVYGIPSEPDVLHLRREVLDGAQAIENMTGVAPHWYRGATAEYDSWLPTRSGAWASRSWASRSTPTPAPGCGAPRWRNACAMCMPAT